MECGELSQESFEFKHIEWKISNVLPLPNIWGYKKQSKVFSFAGATWRLQMQFYCGEFVAQDSINLMIVRLDSQISEHYIFYKFCFETCNGKEFESISDSFLFDSDNNEDGIYEFITRSKFMQKKNLIAPNGVLTILCDMRTKMVPRISRCIQVQSAESFTVYSGMNTQQQAINNTMNSSHDDQILSDFKKLLLDQEDCDVVINVKGKEFQAHKLILKARSPVLASTFRNDMKEKSTGIVDIEDCDPSVFPDFLSFLYCGDVENLSVENMFDLFTVADKYDVQNLRKKCLQFVKANLSVDTFCDTIRLALQHSESELIKLSTDFFTKHLQEIIVTVKWQLFLAENPTESNEILIKALVPNKSLK